MGWCLLTKLKERVEKILPGLAVVEYENTSYENRTVNVALHFLNGACIRIIGEDYTYREIAEEKRDIISANWSYIEGYQTGNFPPLDIAKFKRKLKDGFHQETEHKLPNGDTLTFVQDVQAHGYGSTDYELWVFWNQKPTHIFINLLSECGGYDGSLSIQFDDFDFCYLKDIEHEHGTLRDFKKQFCEDWEKHRSFVEKYLDNVRLEAIKALVALKPEVGAWELTE